jgi:hypothetical protein
MRQLMANMQMEDQISVPLNSELRQQIERIARDEHRTIAGQVRHWIAAALGERGDEQRERAA